MKKNPKFHGKITAGNKLEIYEKDRAMLNNYLRGFKPGSVVSIVIKQDKIIPIRSLEANAYYWAVVLPIACESLGYAAWEKEEVHEAFKHKFIGKEDCPGLIISPSTASLPSDEFWEYINQIKHYMMMVYGCYIPDPNEIA